MTETLRHLAPDRSRLVPPVLPGEKIDLFKPNDTAFFIMHQTTSVDLTTIPDGFKIRRLGLEEIVEKAGHQGFISIVWNPEKARVSYYDFYSRESQLDFERDIRQTGVNMILPSSIPLRSFLFRIGPPDNTRH